MPRRTRRPLIEHDPSQAVDQVRRRRTT